MATSTDAQFPAHSTANGPPAPCTDAHRRPDEAAREDVGGKGVVRSQGRKASRPQRVRETTLGPVDWAKVDPLALSMADRQTDSDARYERKSLSADGVEHMKMRWQSRQLKRVSNAAVMFGPRESIRHLFVDEEEQEEERDAMGPLARRSSTVTGSRDLSACSTPTASSSAAGAFRRPLGSVSGASMASQDSTRAAVAAGTHPANSCKRKGVLTQIKSMLSRKSTPTDAQSMVDHIQDNVLRGVEVSGTKTL
mmetsp:Transcript_27195/g.69024  ORF Transcript_27195/g.69024 Transcript_27195/m.69024 type:complete len:252 (-) Transcript_27195:129-884(-)|eukprot:CAMPEP_0174921556 /NCGR_PEP_ID=MMETSP1355-20121228/5228_1 /TAXON_ID=464990 /ORGANISM="Hemiselmis tepida, Strain CCMP443" /LENGTH=251 /DNA_ID=CAMNT_0016167053 /DNA_START=54 /DNA_END=809 /DNA_ORIENTATION=-